MNEHEMELRSEKGEEPDSTAMDIQQEIEVEDITVDGICGVY
jgi:mycofactocin precursor